MSARDTATAKYVADNGGERWEIPGDEAFKAGWDAGVKAVLARVREYLGMADDDGLRDIAREFAVPEEPVPPLPTEPYTVIRVTWRTGGSAGFTLKQDGTWRGANADMSAKALALTITGFEVLAEPINSQEAIKRVADRAFKDGVKAALARVREQSGRFIPKGNVFAAADAVARELGVDDA